MSNNTNIHKVQPQHEIVFFIIPPQTRTELLEAIKSTFPRLKILKCGNCTFVHDSTIFNPDIKYEET